MSARCLVADDHPALLQAVCDFLGANGVVVVGTAPDGERAVALAAETRPDIALVDFRMPRLAGVELIARLRDTSPETKIVVYTADADEALVRTSLGAGASAVLLKESPLDDLVRAIETAAAGATYVDPALATFGLDEAIGTPVLTDRECSVLTLLAEGKSHGAIGAELSISGETVRTHVRKASARLGASTRTEAVAKALRLGLIV
jgi:two-component system nitrate/nitrite response regulator NarL